MQISPPTSEQELLCRVEKIAGLTLSQLANQISWSTPKNLLHNKGWIGQLLETALGASAGSLSEPDFQNLGVELKTIPINMHGKAAETTYVCVVPLENHIGLSWTKSCVARKLSRVLWIPIESGSGIPLSERRVGMGFIWSPNSSTLNILKSDWEELMEYVALGQIDEIDASYGDYLQIRPKAANAKARTVGISQSGKYKQTLPRGFYLRTSFTNIIMSEFQNGK